MLCHASMTTAMPRMDALKSSWPMPSASSEMSCAPPATASEPTTPSARPAKMKRARPAMPRVAALTMPTMSAASRTSRKTMSAVPNILFGDDRAPGALLVVLADELVFAGLERAHVDGRLPLARDHLLDLERLALELLGRRVLVLDEQLHFLSRGNLDAIGRELVSLDRELELGLARGENAERRGHQHDCGKAAHRFAILYSNDTNK